MKCDIRKEKHIYVYTSEVSCIRYFSVPNITRAEAEVYTSIYFHGILYNMLSSYIRYVIFGKTACIING